MVSDQWTGSSLGSFFISTHYRLFSHIYRFGNVIFKDGYRDNSARIYSGHKTHFRTLNMHKLLWNIIFVDFLQKFAQNSTINCSNGSYSPSKNERFCQRIAQKSLIFVRGHNFHHPFRTSSIDWQRLGFSHVALRLLITTMLSHYYGLGGRRLDRNYFVRHYPR